MYENKPFFGVNQKSILQGLGMVSINIGPVCSQKLKFRHLLIFLVGIIC
jgi:hypothetical protein